MSRSGQVVSQEREKSEQWSSHAPLFIPVEDRRENLVHVGACAYQEQQDEEEGLEVEEGRLWFRDGQLCCLERVPRVPAAKEMPTILLVQTAPR